MADRERIGATAGARRPHAVLDLDSRALKGAKIERLLRLPDAGARLRLLEVGCGGGGISEYFGRLGKFDVWAVDTVDQRQVDGHYRFQVVDGVRLPFEDEAFDVVIGNHVIEHVGERECQVLHLRELARTLKRSGVGYIAVPNRWALVEPHFGVLFLSWLPRRLRSSYLRHLRGTHYDCEPLGPRELDRMLRNAGFVAERVEDEALQAMLDLGELRGWLAVCVRACPPTVLRLLRPLMPTLIRRVRHAGAPGAAGTPTIS